MSTLSAPRAPEGGDQHGVGHLIRGAGTRAVLTSLVTTALAFLVGGLVILATGHNPLATYRGVFTNAGINWLFPWVTGDARSTAAENLQQTLLVTTALILTGLAVAFAFRCGLFNIGGQGQWHAGAIVSTWVGSTWAGLAGPAHIILAIVLATLAGALVAGIAGILKATVGAHEVITTIMLNWILYWFGKYVFSPGGPLENSGTPSLNISDDISANAHLPVFWGDPEFQGLHIGLFIALGALVAFWLTLSRTTLGFRVRAVGRSPEAARYGGIGVGKSYFLAMAISGAFAGLAGGLDILGWIFHLGVQDIEASQIGFIGIAVALLGRNTPIGVGLAALLFGALIAGTSNSSDLGDFAPELAGNLSTMIQGLVVLFVGADVLVLYLFKRRRLRLPSLGRSNVRRGRVNGSQRSANPTAFSFDLNRVSRTILAAIPRGVRAVAIGSLVIGALAAWVAVPPIAARSIASPIVLGVIGVAGGLFAAMRGQRRLGLIAVAVALIGASCGVLATHSGIAHLQLVFLWPALALSMLRYATPLIFASVGGMFSERSGVVNIGLEGMMLTGAFFAILGADKLGTWWLGLLCAIVAGGALALLHAFLSIHLRADQIVSGTAINFLALGITGFLFVLVYPDNGTPSGISVIPDVNLGFIDGVPFFGRVFGHLNLMIWLSFFTLGIASFVMFRTPFGLRLRAAGEHPRAAETVGLSVYAIRYKAVIISGMLAAMGGAFLSLGYVHSFTENMTFGRGFIALAALIVGNWYPKGAFLASLLFGFGYALGQRLPVYSQSAGTLFETLP